MLCFERKRSTSARDVDLYLSRQFCLNEFMIYALVYACKYDLQITATDTVVLLLFYSGFEGKGCGWMDGGINSLMKLFIYLFILCMSVVHYVAMPLPFLLVIKCCQSTGMSARRYSAGEGRCVSSDCGD